MDQTFIKPHLCARNSTGIRVKAQDLESDRLEFKSWYQHLSWGKLLKSLCLS